VTLTSEELARLRVPLDRLPGFDPVGLRVIGEDGLPAGLVTLSTGVHVFLADDVNEDGSNLHYPADFDANLSDSATADRVARWCAGRVGLEVGCTAPGWRSYSARADPPLAIWLFGELGLGVRVFANQPRRDPPLTGWAYSRAVENVVPALADLDPTDARLLPDGARWIDRLALALVATHLGGTP
jgi:hypothetical protein